MQILFNLKSALAWICTIGHNWCSWLMDHGSDWSQRVQLMDLKNVPCTWLKRKHFRFGILPFSNFLIIHFVNAMDICIGTLKVNDNTNFSSSIRHNQKRKKVRYTVYIQSIENRWMGNKWWMVDSNCENDEQTNKTTGLFVSPFPIKMNVILCIWIYIWNAGISFGCLLMMQKLRQTTMKYRDERWDSLRRNFYFKPNDVMLFFLNESSHECNNIIWILECTALHITHLHAW